MKQIDRGELQGTVTSKILGDIKLNTQNGIYGTLKSNESISKKNEANIGYKNEIKEGKAYIYCTLDSSLGTRKYEINIDKVFLNSEGNKNMIITITDKDLIALTGGIVQGMSGCPIVQDDKIIGAITHVFVNDPTKGYAVFIENMVQDMYMMENSS